jgi:hypothetical protein
MFWSLLMEHAAFKILPLTVAVGVVERPAMPNDPGRPILKPSAPLQVLHASLQRRRRVPFQPPLYTVHQVFVFLVTFSLTIAVVSIYLEHPNGATATVYHDVCSVEMNCIPTAHRAPTELGLRPRLSSSRAISSSLLSPKLFSHPTRPEYTRRRRAMPHSRPLG